MPDTTEATAATSPQDLGDRERMPAIYLSHGAPPLADDAARAHVVLSAQGTLVGVTEVDIRTGVHSFKADEPRSLGGGGAANSMQHGAGETAEHE